VYIDTDTVGIEGCFFCVSRTFVCGGVEAAAEERATYQAAYEWVRGMTARVAPVVPERFRAQRYECMIHGAGLEEESPSVCHPQDAQSNPGREIRRDMVLVVETYMGEVG